MNQNRGFFQKLFDLSFSSFITPQIVGILYVLGLILAALFSLRTVVDAFGQDGFVEGVGTMTASALGLLVYAVFLRVSLEGFIAVVRTAENTRILAEDVLARKVNGSASIN